MSSYKAILDKFNSLAEQYAGMVDSEAFRTFARLGYGTANMPQIQNQRIKQIATLPVNYTKQQIEGFLREPYFSEIPLQQTSQILKWTVYPYYKLIKTYADIPSYKYYTKPLYIDGEQAKTEEFKREFMLVDKLNKVLQPDVYAHRIAGQALSLGKVFYTYRADVDKSHNKVNHIFLQQLPQEWCWIIGYNNISKYTVSFNMMYFMQPGTDYRQFGDLFEPYLEDFNEMFEAPKKPNKKYVYASKNAVDCKGKSVTFYPERLKSNAIGNPKIYQQNGKWMYYVSLPIDKIFAFEIDDTTPVVAPPLSGLMVSYSQLPNYEALQKELVTNPLLKIFTGEIPFFSDNGTTTEDGYRLSDGARFLFETYFNQLMSYAGIGGSVFFSAPAQNIKSHDYPETATANQTSEAYNSYLAEKSGMNTIIPSSQDVKASQVEVAKLVEGRYVTATIYPQFERMMSCIYNSLNLKYDWQFVMYGTIFKEKEIRENALKDIANGDISAYYILASLDNESICDKLSMMNTIKEIGLLDKLTPIQTSYTISGSDNKGGRPSEDIDEKEGETAESISKKIEQYGEADNG